MTERDELVARIVAIVEADPAVQAAGDQLRAAARDNRPPGEAEGEAIGTIVGVALSRTIEELGIPPERVPATLEALARLWEQDRP